MTWDFCLARNNIISKNSKWKTTAINLQVIVPTTKSNNQQLTTYVCGSGLTKKLSTSTSLGCWTWSNLIHVVVLQSDFQAKKKQLC